MLRYEGEWTTPSPSPFRRPRPRVSTVFPSLILWRLPNLLVPPTDYMHPEYAKLYEKTSRTCMYKARTRTHAQTCQNNTMGWDGDGWVHGARSARRFFRKRICICIFFSLVNELIHPCAFDIALVLWVACIVCVMLGGEGNLGEDGRPSAKLEGAPLTAWRFLLCQFVSSISPLFCYFPFCYGNLINFKGLLSEFHFIPA